MRKIAWLLCLLMILFLAACGSTNTTDDSQGGDGAGASEASTVPETSTPPQSETSEPTEENTPIFDISWASNEFEALLPKPPFVGWTVTAETDSVYKMEVGGLKTNTSTGIEADAADKIALVNYLDSLSVYGFTVKETGEGYEWLVTDASGNTAEFRCGDGYCFVTITKAAS